MYRTNEAGLIYLGRYQQLIRLLPTIPDLPDPIEPQPQREESPVVNE
jgi:hypothetical protein